MSETAAQDTSSGKISRRNSLRLSIQTSSIPIPPSLRQSPYLDSPIFNEATSPRLPTEAEERWLQDTVPVDLPSTFHSSPSATSHVRERSGSIKQRRRPVSHPAGVLPDYRNPLHIGDIPHQAECPFSPRGSSYALPAFQSGGAGASGSEDMLDKMERRRSQTYKYLAASLAPPCSGAAGPWKISPPSSSCAARPPWTCSDTRGRRASYSGGGGYFADNGRSA